MADLHVSLPELNPKMEEDDPITKLLQFKAPVADASKISVPDLSNNILPAAPAPVILPATPAPVILPAAPAPVILPAAPAPVILPAALFFGKHHFSQCNAYLEKHGMSAINWR
jgi:hypothetical protein